jgi:hypothetical protein
MLIIPATQEAETGGSQIQGQPGQLSRTLSQHKNFLKGLSACLATQSLESSPHYLKKVTEQKNNLL